jgi:hypothetical protein
MLFRNHDNAALSFFFFLGIQQRNLLELLLLLASDSFVAGSEGLWRVVVETFLRHFPTFALCVILSVLS